MAAIPAPGTRSALTRRNVLRAIADVRRQGGANEASKADVLRSGKSADIGFARRSLDKYGEGAFEQRGRTSVLRRTDRIERRMDTITYQRGVELGRSVRTSTDATKVSHWQNALGDYMRTGDEGPLLALSEVDRTIDRGRTVLVNDLDELQALMDSGALDRFREEVGS
jgi:hypothetical protein